VVAFPSSQAYNPGARCPDSEVSIGTHDPPIRHHGAERGTHVEMQPFVVAVSEETLTDLQERLARTRSPDKVANAHWEYGTNLAYLKEGAGCSSRLKRPVSQTTKARTF
jgi:Epoxide hydrolase N terminus